MSQFLPQRENLNKEKEFPASHNPATVPAKDPFVFPFLPCFAVTLPGSLHSSFSFVSMAWLFFLLYAQWGVKALWMERARIPVKKEILHCRLPVSVGVLLGCSSQEWAVGLRVEYEKKNFSWCWCSRLRIVPEQLYRPHSFTWRCHSVGQVDLLPPNANGRRRLSVCLGRGTNCRTVGAK